MMSTEQRNHYLEILKNRLSPRRFKHSIGVEKTAIELAGRFGADKEKAQKAGLLHDIAKNLSLQEMEQMMANHNRELDKEMEHNPGLLHGAAGAVLLEREYGICDQEILQAVAWHTTGKPGMNILEKIIYLADMIEPNRNFPGVDELRKIAEINLDQAILEAMARTISFVVQEKKWLHPISAAAYNDLLK